MDGGVEVIDANLFEGEVGISWMESEPNEEYEGEDY